MIWFGVCVASAECATPASPRVAATNVAALPTPPQLNPSPVRAPQDLDLGFYAHVSARVLNDLLQREVKRRENVFESILRSTRGTADVTCQLALELVPNSEAATVRFRMNGRAVMANMVGTTRSVQVYSSSNTRITGYKDVLIDETGLKLLPAQAQCRASVQVANIEAPMRVIERIAWRRVERSQSQAEEIASQRAARRAEQQLDADVGKPLRQLHDAYVENVVPLLAGNEALPKIRVATTHGHLSIKLLTPAAGERSGATPQPAYDVAVLVRDRFVNDVAAMLMSNKTFHDAQVANWMQILTGKAPPALWVHDRADPWSLSTAERPLDVRFQDELVHIALHIAGATRGEEVLERPLTVTAAYAMEITRDGPHLVRSGDVELTFDDAESTTDERADEFRQFLARKFNGVFPPDLYFDGLIPPAGGSWAKLHSLSLTQVAAQNGWFAIGYMWNAKSTIAANAPR